jgi:hypothetical protein
MHNLLEETRWRTLDEQISINEGVLTEDDLDGFVNHICEGLTDKGYTPPDEFTLEALVEVISDLSSQPELEESFKKWLGRAASAVKGAVSRGVSKLTRGYHKSQTTKHAKKMNDAWNAGDKDAYVHHSVKMHSHWKKSDPKHFQQQTDRAKKNKWGVPGTQHHAEKTWTSHPSEKHQAALKARKHKPLATSPELRAAAAKISASSKFSKRSAKASPTANTSAGGARAARKKSPRSKAASAVALVK